MQKVFEKIIEKLEELAESNRESGFDSERKGFSNVADKSYAKQCAYLNAIKIVKQAAAECKHGHFGCNSNGEHEKCSKCCDYDCKNRNREWFGAKDDNNGWIPCSERMPKERDSAFAKLKGTTKWRDSMFEKISEEVNVTITDEKGEKATTHAHTTDGIWKCDILRACPTYRVIAWQPFPASYHQSGEHKKKTNFDRCCESVEAMAQIIDIAKIGWTKEQIIEWLQKEQCEVPE